MNSCDAYGGMMCCVATECLTLSFSNEWHGYYGRL